MVRSIRRAMAKQYMVELGIEKPNGKMWGFWRDVQASDIMHKAQPKAIERTRDQNQKQAQAAAAGRKAARDIRMSLKVAFYPIATSAARTV